MNENEIKELVELLVPYLKKSLKSDNDFKTSVKRKNATVVGINKDENGSTLNQTIKIQLPYDTISFEVKNKTDEELAVGDLVCIEYCIDLKNAVAVYKT